MNTDIETIICLPGPWKDRSELVERIVRDSDGYIFAGFVMSKMDTQEHFEIDFCDYDERMPNAFEASGPHWSGTEEMERIKGHKSVVYLIGKSGSEEGAHSIMDAAKAILEAGAFGVKIENTGLAHSPQAWRKLCEEKYLFSAHQSFVIYVTDDVTYSCGMHNLGLKDALVQSNDSIDSVELLRGFTRYMYAEKPEIKAGQTFATGENEPAYILREHRGVNYGEDSLFNNPYGTWYLELYSEANV